MVVIFTYIYLLDASKAFDKVHYGKLFNISLNENVPYFIIRLLMDGHVRQEARVIWNSYKLTYFRVKNCVKQGFHLHIDILY